MKKVGFIYDDIYLKHEMPQMHPECGERLKSIVATLKGSDVWDRLIHIAPRRATFEEIALVHDPDYVERMKGFGTGYADPDTYLSEGTIEAAQFAAGAVTEAVRRCREGEIERAFCAVRPPGHHAEAGRAMGFCIFNNVAVGARYAQGLGFGKVFIIDFDVHHGNGTQHIFDGDPSVYYFSTHQHPHYPGTGGEDERGTGKGAGFTYNVPMRAGFGDREYMEVYGDLLPGLMSGFGPDMVIVSAGYDIHANDPLSGMRVTAGGIRAIVRGALSTAGVPAVFALEGGYDLGALAEGVLATVSELLNAG